MPYFKHCKLLATDPQGCQITSTALHSDFTHPENKNSYFRMKLFSFSIHLNLTHEADWETKHSGLQYNTLQLDIKALHKQTPESPAWQSHLLCVSAEHRSPPGLWAQPPPVHTLLHSETSAELYWEVCGWHGHRQPHDKQQWEFMPGGNQQSCRVVHRRQLKPRS